MVQHKARQLASEVVNEIRQADSSQLEQLCAIYADDTRASVQKALQAALRRVEKEQQEKLRIQNMFAFDANFSNGPVLGLDEVGRGSVAGPLAVGGVVLPQDAAIPFLNDSKQLSSSQRSMAAKHIKQQALCWTVQYVDPQEIDSLGMGACLRKAFSCAIAAIEQTGFTLQAVLLDGVAMHIHPHEHNVVKGDGRSASIAAASILAKVERDALMVEMAAIYPEYGFDKHKGYGSAAHRQAIQQFGLCPIHRKSFCSGFLQDSLF